MSSILAKISETSFFQNRRVALAAVAGASALALLAIAPSAASAQTYSDEGVVATYQLAYYCAPQNSYHSSYGGYRQSYGSYGGYSSRSYGYGGYGGHGYGSRNQTW